LGETLGALWPFLFVGAYVLLALLMVPGAILTMLAGAFFGIVQGTVLVSVGATIVAMIAFVFARRMGQKDVEALLQKHRRARALQAAVRRSGWRAVLLLRLSPVVPFSLSNYLYGLTGVPLGSYVLATWAGTLPGALLYVWLGHLGFLSASEGVERPWTEWLPLIVGLAATVLVTVHLARLAKHAASLDDDAA
jgi:uncharacterized membrane protein YdjX (TVP38/TMEM64 family)